MKSTIYKNNNRSDAARQYGMRGISMPEIIIVLVIIGILSAISLPYIFQYRTRYRSEDQALKVMDLMREAGQMAIIKRRTFRVEIDLFLNRLLIIDEDTTVNPAVHREIKAIPLDPIEEVRMDVAPTGVTKPNPPNYANAVFATDTTGHQRGNVTINGDTVWAARFNRDGTVVNGAGIPVSATLYLFPPKTPGSAVPRSLQEVRAITIFGGSGAVRYWKYDGTTFVAQN